MSFEECPACAAKPGAPTLCRECLERRRTTDALQGDDVRDSVEFTKMFTTLRRIEGDPTLTLEEARAMAKRCADGVGGPSYRRLATIVEALKRTMGT